MWSKVKEEMNRVVHAPGWPLKVLIGGVFSCFPIINALSFGYVMHYLDDRENEIDADLPDWSDLETLFKRGLPVALLTLGAILAMMVINMVLAIVPTCLSAPVSLIFGLAVGFFLPIVTVIYMDRLRGGTAWKEALDWESMVANMRQGFPEYGPLQVLWVILGPVAFILSLCSLGLLAPVFYFILFLAFAPLLSEIHKRNLEISNGDEEPEESLEESPEESPEPLADDSTST